MRMRALGPAVMAAVLTGWGVGSPALAQGWIDVVGRGSLVRLRTGVTARVTGRVARVEVEEWFQNRGGALAEGDYQYPLPGEGTFADLSLWQGDRELKGETMDASRARAIYEEIVRRRRDPALVELVGHGLIRARVFPIGPGETRRITLRYTQVLARSGDALLFRYAASAPGRGTPGGPPPPRPRPPIFPPGGPSLDIVQEDGPGVTHGTPGGSGVVDLTLVAEDGSAFRDPFSPTHELRTERRDGRLRVKPAGELTGDLTILLPLRNAAAAAIGLATYRTGSDDGYALITLSPSEAREAAVARDVTFVLDVSGSMSGDKLEQARRAARNLLASLSPEDRFRLIAFSSDVDPYRSGWSSGTPGERAAATAWLDRLQAHGSTDIGGALREAFRTQPGATRLPVVIFLTDGLPTAGEQEPDRIATMAERERGRARVFAFGVGYDVNTRLLDGLSAAARGATAYVEPGEDLERPVSTLAAKIQRPVLTDLRLAGAPVELRALYPDPLPDLFAGDELVLLARYRGAGAGQLVFEGKRGGQDVRFAAAVDFRAEARADDYVPRLWASRRIGTLTREIRLHGANPELVNEVRELALRYGILTEYTAYLVQEPMQVAELDRALPVAPSVSGQFAVQEAAAGAARRDVAKASQLAQLEARVAVGYAADSRRNTVGDSRVVAGRRFEKRDGVWVDGGRRDAGRVVSVEPFSAAYFEVLRALPELRVWWSALEQVDVAGARVRIRAAAGGARTLPPADIERLVREFRRS